MRHFLMTTQGLTEDEAISLMPFAVDFGITPVVDGNWGVHAVIKKGVFPGGRLQRQDADRRRIVQTVCYNLAQSGAKNRTPKRPSPTRHAFPCSHSGPY